MLYTVHAKFEFHSLHNHHNSKRQLFLSTVNTSDIWPEFLPFDFEIFQGMWAGTIFSETWLQAN